MQNCNSASVRSSEHRAAASGEVGLLGEEAAQRLLSIFGEAATCCLAQVRELALKHGVSKHDALFEVGLNLVLKWDLDIANEETSRMEIAYPEIASLHTYVFLWLLDRLCSNEDLRTPAIPVIGEIYAAFMKRIAGHRDVRKGQSFLESSELVRRSLYVDAFRCVYHDAVQKAIRRRGHYAEPLPHLNRRPREAHVVPEEAASQVGSLQMFNTKADSLSEKAYSIVSGAQPNATSAFKLAMRNEAETVKGHSADTPPIEVAQQHSKILYTVSAQAKALGDSEDDNQACSESSEVAPPSASHASGDTKAVTLQGACFFKESESNQKAPPI